MYIRRIEGTWFLFNHGEIVESFDSRSEAQLALFDATRRWRSYYDVEA